MEFEFLDEYIFEKDYENFSRKNNEVYKDLFNVIMVKNKEAFTLGYNNGLEDGIERGIATIRAKIIMNLLRNTKMSDEEIYKIVGEDKNIDLLEFIRKSREELKAIDVAVKEKTKSIVKDYRKEIKDNN